MKSQHRYRYNIRIWTEKDEHRAQRRGGYNRGIRHVVEEEQDEVEMAAFCADLYGAESAARQSGRDER